MPPELLSSPISWTVLIGAIAALIYSISKSFPEMLKVWHAERPKALEYRRTREQAGQVALTETFGQIFAFIREDREQDRTERAADREEAVKLREQITRLAENIHLLTNRIAQTNDIIRILSSNAAIHGDELQKLQSEVRGITRELKNA